MPIIEKIEKITIVEPSKKLRSKKVGNIIPRYIDPLPSGEIKLKDNSISLITCFGVLHHIPNVSKIISEFTRVLERGGYLLIREPIVSMGDWRKKRRGLTSRERGIPEKIMLKIVKNNNFKIISKRKIMFPLTSRLRERFNRREKALIPIDFYLSKLFSWNNKYHSNKFYHKIKPSSVFYVLKKK